MSRHEKVKQITNTIKEYARKNKLLDVNAVKVIVALERIIARLINHKKLIQHIIFKGGFVLLKTTPSLRFTRDADVLATEISKDDLIILIKEAIQQDLEDGFWFGEVEVKDLPLQGKYGACRLRFPFQIGDPKQGKEHKFSRLHIDIGFSDKITIQPEEKILNAVLNYEEPISWKIYPKEFTLAEKLHAFCERLSGSSRAKDLYDISLIFSLCDDKSAVKQAITQTFQNRDLDLPESFAKIANSLNLKFLKAAWPNVFVISEKPEFDDLWKEFVVTLEKIDQVLLK